MTEKEETSTTVLEDFMSKLEVDAVGIARERNYWITRLTSLFGTNIFFTILLFSIHF
jgi:hypothetical protein